MQYKIQTYILPSMMNKTEHNVSASTKDDLKEIKKIISDFSTMHSLDEAYQYIDSVLSSNPNFKTLDLNVFQYKDSLIRTGKTINFKDEIENLIKLNNLDLSCAPKLLAVVPLNNQEVVIINKIKNCNNAKFNSYMTEKSNVPVAAKQALVRDFDILSKHLLYNPIINNSTKNWLVISPHNTIYIDDWSTLKTITSEAEKQTLRKEICDMCGLIYS